MLGKYPSSSNTELMNFKNLKKANVLWKIYFLKRINMGHQPLYFMIVSVSPQLFKIEYLCAAI